jgi:hypothetical protein
MLNTAVNCICFKETRHVKYHYGTKYLYTRDVPRGLTAKCERFRAIYFQGFHKVVFSQYGRV